MLGPRCPGSQRSRLCHPVQSGAQQQRHPWEPGPAQTHRIPARTVCDGVCRTQGHLKIWGGSCPLQPSWQLSEKQMVIISGCREPQKLLALCPQWRLPTLASGECRGNGLPMAGWEANAARAESLVSGEPRWALELCRPGWSGLPSCGSLPGLPDTSPGRVPSLCQDPGYRHPGPLPDSPATPWPRASARTEADHDLCLHVCLRAALALGFHLMSILHLACPEGDSESPSELQLCVPTGCRPYAG